MQERRLAQTACRRHPAASRLKLPNFAPQERDLRKSMRRTVRPFITEYKSRSSKSRVSRMWDIDELENTSLKSPSIEASTFARPASLPSDIQRDAINGADAVFGNKAVEVDVSPTPSIAPAGRILPCLLQNIDAAAASPSEATKLTRRARTTGKVAKKLPIGRTKPVSRPRREIAMPSVETPATELIADKSLDVPTRRERSAVQRRWVRKTELKPGERWKRRLCDAAR